MLEAKQSENKKRRNGISPFLLLIDLFKKHQCFYRSTLYSVVVDQAALEDDLTLFICQIAEAQIKFL